MKHYKKGISNVNFQFSNNSQISKSKKQKKYKIPDTKYKILNIYHIDAYRVGSKDVLDLGWEEIVAGENNIAIVEWAERIKSIIPKRAVWIKFRHGGKNEREITIC